MSWYIVALMTVNCRLQYKYMKLVESANEKDGELPAAETCALDEGEEDEHFDAVEFKSKGRKFLKKFKKPSAKKVNKLSFLML